MRGESMTCRQRLDDLPVCDRGSETERRKSLRSASRRLAAHRRGRAI